MNNWQKLTLYCFIVILPATALGISNAKVFPDSFWMATILLVICVGVAGIFTWFSRKATNKVARYCAIANFVICTVLCVNLIAHWVLTREVSASKTAVADRHEEEDRQAQRAKADAEQEIAKTKANTELTQAQAQMALQERHRLNALPVARRTSQMPSVASAQTPATALVPALPAATPREGKTAPVRTPGEILEAWWLLLTILAAADCVASILSAGILAAVWEWDLNGNGIDDALERPTRQPITMAPPQTVKAENQNP